MLIWVLLVIEKWFKETHCVIYFTVIDSILFDYLTSKTIIQYVLANFLCYFVAHLVIEKWFMKAQYGNYSMNIDSFLMHNLTSEKIKHFCWIIYCVQFGYFWSLKSYWIRHTMLAVPQRFIQVYCIISSVKKSEARC